MFPLAELCSLGMVSLVRAALAGGVDVNVQNKDGETALMRASVNCSHHNHVTIMKLLLEHPSIDVNKEDRIGRTALIHAIQKGNIKAVKILLGDRRVDMNCTIPPLTMAVAGKHPDIFKLILTNQRVDVNQTYQSMTALMIASGKSDVEAAKLLLNDPRVEVNLVNCKGWSALLLAIKDRKTFELFLSHERVNVNCVLPPNNINVLHIAALKNNVEAVKLILAEPRITLANAVAEPRGTALREAIL